MVNLNVFLIVPTRKTFEYMLCYTIVTGDLQGTVNLSFHFKMHACLILIFFSLKFTLTWCISSVQKERSKRPHSLDRSNAQGNWSVIACPF